MFAHRAKDGALNVEWEVLDESNLPVDLVRRDGEEYSFVLPVSFDGRAAIQEESVGVRVDDPESASAASPCATEAAADFNTVTLARGVFGVEVPDGGPVAGISGRSGCGSENTPTNV